MEGIAQLLADARRRTIHFIHPEPRSGLSAAETTAFVGELHYYHGLSPGEIAMCVKRDVWWVRQKLGEYEPPNGGDS